MLGCSTAHTGDRPADWVALATTRIARRIGAACNLREDETRWIGLMPPWWAADPGGFPLHHKASSLYGVYHHQVVGLRPAHMQPQRMMRRPTYGAGWWPSVDCCVLEGLL